MSIELKLPTEAELIDELCGGEEAVFCYAAHYGYVCPEPDVETDAG